MVLRRGATNYEAISWDDAFALIASELNSLGHPDEAIFYTSGTDEQRSRVSLPTLRAAVWH